MNKNPSLDLQTIESTIYSDFTSDSVHRVFSSSPESSRDFSDLHPRRTSSVNFHPRSPKAFLTWNLKDSQTLNEILQNLQGLQ